MMTEHLIDQAVEVFTQEGEVSISLMQRRLRLGYSTAREVMEMLESRGIVILDSGGGRCLTAARNTN